MPHGTGYALVFSSGPWLRVNIQDGTHIVQRDDWRLHPELRLRADGLIEWLEREYPSMEVDGTLLRVVVVETPVTIATELVRLRVIYGDFEAPAGDIYLSGLSGLDYQVRV